MPPTKQTTTDFVMQDLPLQKEGIDMNSFFHLLLRPYLQFLSFMTYLSEGLKLQFPLSLLVDTLAVPRMQSVALRQENQVMNEADGSDVASPFSVLPPELKEMVWLFLPFPEMCLMNEVCRSWRDTLSGTNERFWSLVHQAEFGGPKDPKSISWFEDLKATCKEYSNSYSGAILNGTPYDDPYRPLPVSFSENWAAKKGHYKLVHTLFDGLPFSDDSDPNQEEFLFDLILGREFSLAQRLIEKYPGMVQHQYTAYVYAAARVGNLNLLRSMIENYDASADTALRHNKWPYDIAAERGHIDIMHYLHTIPALQSTLPRQKGPYCPKRHTTLFYAVRGGHLDVVRLLVEERHHPLTSDLEESRWDPSLMTIAIAKQRWPIVEYLQSKGMKLQREKAALEYAARKGNLALANYIIDHHLQHLRDPQERWMKFRNALRFAAQQAKKHQSDKMFMLLLDRSGLHFDPITNPLQDKKLLMKGADGNSVTILQKLWDLGCRNIDDPRILSFLFFPGMPRDAIGVVEWLLEHGTNPCVTCTRHGSVPNNIICDAIESSMPEVAVKLIYAVNNWLQTHPPSEEQPEQQDSTMPKKTVLRITQLNQGEEENTPYQYAVWAGYTSVIEALLANGIDAQLYPRAMKNLAITDKRLPMIRVLIKAGAKPDENILRDILQSRCDCIAKLRAAKTLINRGKVQPTHLHSALTILGGSCMNPQGSTRLVKFLLKKGTGVSWSDLQSFATTSTPVEETAVLEVLRACVVEDQKSEETLREDYKEKKADALHATLFFAENQKYWRLLKVTARQEGIELNRDTRHAKEETALVSIIRSHSRDKCHRRFHYRGQSALYYKAIHRLIKHGALVTWECFYREREIEASILNKAFEAQARGLSSIEDPQKRNKAEEVTRRALSNLLCRSAKEGDINRMQWVVHLAADVDQFKSSIITSTWQGPDDDELREDDTALFAAVKGGASVAVFELLLAHGADKAAFDAQAHTAAFRAKRKELSSEIQELLNTPGCDEEEESALEGMFGFED